MTASERTEVSRSDTERLDWLGISDDDGSHTRVDWSRWYAVSKLANPGTDGRGESVGLSIRAAIDAAMECTP